MKSRSGIERVAHRGAPRERIENTLEGFELAIAHGADAIELDVHCTVDGVPVVHHDFEVEGRELRQASWNEVRELDLGGGARVPTLEAVLRSVKDRAMVYIEVKGHGIEAQVVEVARRHGQQYAFHAFDHGAIERIATLAPESRRGILLDRNLEQPVPRMRQAVRRTGARDVWPHWTLVDAAFIDAAHDVGARVIAWTVNAVEVARSLSAMGIDGLCTDDVRIIAGM